MPPEASTRGEGFAGVERSFWLAKLRIGIRVRGMRPVVARIQDGILVVEDAHGQRVDCHISVGPVMYLLLEFNRITPWNSMLRGQLVTWGRRPWRVNEFGSLLQT